MQILFSLICSFLVLIGIQRLYGEHSALFVFYIIMLCIGVFTGWCLRFLPSTLPAEARPYTVVMLGAMLLVELLIIFHIFEKAKEDDRNE